MHFDEIISVVIKSYKLEYFSNPCICKKVAQKMTEPRFFSIKWFQIFYSFYSCLNLDPILLHVDVEKILFPAKDCGAIFRRLSITFFAVRFRDLNNKLLLQVNTL